ncbi:hypothetical protein NC796_07495 [Aliifodinibius sp. S!AR15-10]|uniref:hypothetical protein n=1 Tax=Aliifodinibius sp. S!AR15-10 TaxID=2950437 RepID=UPI00285B767E|nr:hypothetical protein [Aliifodinibius sp. S!AR15-10]MDR8390976.1 hypothetical protein [Aliifodinibius sp. S!AR15-10]
MKIQYKESDLNKVLSKLEEKELQRSIEVTLKDEIKNPVDWENEEIVTTKTYKITVIEDESPEEILNRIKQIELNKTNNN